MKRLIYGIAVLVIFTSTAQTQEKKSIYKIPKTLLSGKGLDEIKQQDSTRVVYQKKVYDGVDIAIYILAIGTGITNEFNYFPLEEFIFWMNGKAIVEPKGEEPFSIYSGDYFIQPKGFNGKWNFVDINGVHLELSLVAKNRPDSTVKSPITHAMILDRDIISGVSKTDDGSIYTGAELTVNLLKGEGALSKNSQERMIHVLNGVLTLTTNEQTEDHFFPGDFFTIPDDFEGQWSSNSIQQIRLLEVYKTKN